MKYDILIASVPKMDKDKPAPGPAYLKSFLQSQTSLFTNFETINIENSPLASYNQAVIDAGKYTLNIEENVKETTDGVTYDKRRTSYS